MWVDKTEIKETMENLNKKINDGKDKNEMVLSAKKLIGVGLVGVVLVISALLLFLCSYKIGPGMAGVIYNIDGGIENETLSQGYHIVAPWKHVSEYPVSTETVYFTNDDTIKENQKSKKGRMPSPAILINSKDGKRVLANATYAYRMNATKLPQIYTKFKGQSIEEIESDYLKSHILMAISDITTQYSQMELSGNRLPEVNQKIFEKLKTELDEIGIEMESFALSGVEPDEQTRQAIQAVINAQNQLEQAKVEKQKAEVEAERARIAARGKADAMLIEAEGQAKANDKLRESLTQMVIEQRRIEKWDGKYPQYMGGNGTALFQIK